MSYSIIQQPQQFQLAQSPVVFSVSSSQYVANPEFQYVAELYIWSGSTTNSSSAEIWTLAKYPSSEGLTGIFDCSRILNSTQTQLAYTTNNNAVKNYKIDSYPRWQSGSVYVTGSHVTSSVLQAGDGYQIFPQQINSQAKSYMTAAWPLMYDGPYSQSALVENTGWGTVYMNYDGTGTNNPTKIKFNSNLGVQYYNLATGSSYTTANIQQTFPLYPSEVGFPLDKNSLTWYTIQAVDNTNTAVGTAEPIRFDIVCNQKYPNVRIAFKNRYGILQYINMNLVNRKSFSSTKRTYQPQLGSWTGQTLSYNSYDSQNLNYIVDSQQRINANTNWLEEEWNEILKQLIVSDEIYMVNEIVNSVYDDKPSNWEYRPLTITSQNIQFKTGVNDHLIQYQFDFDYGQNYKLII